MMVTVVLQPAVFANSVFVMSMALAVAAVVDTMERKELVHSWDCLALVVGAVVDTMGKRELGHS